MEHPLYLNWQRERVLIIYYINDCTLYLLLNVSRDDTTINIRKIEI